MLPAISARASGSLALRALFGNGLASGTVVAACAAIVLPLGLYGRRAGAIAVGSIRFGIVAEHYLLFGELLLEQTDTIFEISNFVDNIGIGVGLPAGRQEHAQEGEEDQVFHTK